MPAGFYIAAHRWLARDGLHKVGHTGDLSRRLSDDAYHTCFPEGWSYAWTYEVRTKEEAARIEWLVLDYCRPLRADDRELVEGELDTLIAVALAAADACGVKGTAMARPAYESKTRSTTAAAVALPDVDERWRRPAQEQMRTKLAHLKLGAQPGAQLGAQLSAPSSAQLSAQPGAQLGAPPGAQLGAPPSAQPNAPQLDAEEAEFYDTGDVIEDDAVAAWYAKPLEPREYQQDAVSACLRELESEGRTILQMACRCGKTPAASELMRHHTGLVLYLVPGLSLLRQTAMKLAGYGLLGAQGGETPVLLVGSDQKEVALGPLSATMTTDAGEIARFFAAAADFTATNDTAAQGQPRRVLVVSTYQSSHLVRDYPFALTVFDEAHRVCGGAALRCFNAALLAPPTGRRLFMTATPAYEPQAITMKDRGLFGGVAYRYHLQQGIAAGHVNSFRLELVALAPEARGAPASMCAAVHSAMGVVDKLLVFCRDIKHVEAMTRELHRIAADAASAGTATGAAAANAGTAAGAAAPPPYAIFTAHSRQQDVDAALQGFSAAGRAVMLNVRMFQEGVEIPSLNGVFFAAPRHSGRDIIQSVCRPLNVAPGKPQSVVFLPLAHDAGRAADDPANLKNYAGVVPFLDALLDEDPRLYDYLLDPACAYPIGILGTHTMPLTEADKRVLLGAVRRVARHGTSRSKRPAERLLRCDRIPWEKAFAEIRRVVAVCRRYPKTTDLFRVGDAHCSLHAIYRHYADLYTRYVCHPSHHAEMLGETGAEVSAYTYSSGSADDAVADVASGSGVNADDASDSGAAADDTSTAGTDGASASDASTADEFAAAGTPRPRLEPYQVAALESLDGWNPYGVEGPYPWGLCMAHLEAWLAEHGGVPPMCDIHQGGFVGLDATPMERLSGALTCINQGDGRDRAGGRVGGGFTIDRLKQRDLDRICAKYGLRWRKQRLPVVLGAPVDAAAGTAAPAPTPAWHTGSLVEDGPPTFIQDSYARFKAYAKAHAGEPGHGPYIREHFPGWPVRHRRMESDGVARAELPPRRKVAPPRARKDAVCATHAACSVRHTVAASK